MTDVREAADRFHRADDVAGAAGSSSTGPGTGTGNRLDPPRPRRRELRRFRRRTRLAVCVYTLTTLAAVSGLVLLGVEGYRTTRNLRGGTEDTGITDSSAPGFQAEVKPTPTRLLLNIDSAGQLTDSQLLVSGPNGQGGAVVFIPGATLIQAADVPGSTLAQLFDSGGTAEVQRRIETILGFSILEVTEVDPAALAELTKSAGTITIQNPDNLFAEDAAGQRQQLFAAGTLDLQPEQVAAYVGLEVKGESATNRSARSQLVWESWLELLDDPARREGLSALQDSVLSAVGSDIAGIASGTYSVKQLPLRRVVIPDEKQGVLFLPDAELTLQQIAPLVPFPTSAFPGQRVKVRVLKGTPSVAIDLAVTKPIVGSGGEIVVIGNADSFDVARSTIVYREPALADAATVIAKQLGLSATPTEDPAQPENIDVSIVLGADFGS